ncbi:hypothetical protein CROQUDRAFT_654119 [Cronartium quercuum f. sp. fusiforme G11]|uniref:Uncharacterized protein n=1 Tax=Cronartium quercuum f. sp. fusiforme G11 TaxID=708437 RepID=A0A9P6TES6_9BASI|nr:hypothetical protein CROQUDRAFT_654119 [Cronartium quercuum f. sp. fusiforme G11]
MWEAPNRLVTLEYFLEPYLELCRLGEWGMPLQDLEGLVPKSGAMIRWVKGLGQEREVKHLNKPEHNEAGKAL